jgi:hypothetical protein
LNRKRKNLIWITVSLGIFVFLAVALLLIGPKLINLEPVREKIRTSLSEELGGKVEYEGIDIAFLPRPRVAVRGAKWSIPGRLKGTLETITVCPEILPLLKGELRISSIRAVAPEFDVKIPQEPEGREEAKAPPSFSALEDKMKAVLVSIALRVPNLAIRIERGRLDLSSGKKGAFSLKDINADIAVPPRNLKVEIHSASNLFENISFHGDFNTENFKGSGRIALSSLRPQALTDSFMPEIPIKLEDCLMDLSLDFKVDGLTTLEADLTAASSHLTLLRGKRGLPLKGFQLNASLNMYEDGILLSLNDLHLNDPQVQIHGKLLVDRKSPHVSIELSGDDIAIAPIREAGMALAGDIPITEEIFSLLRGGSLPRIKIKMHGKSWSDLGDLEQTHIAAQITDGNIVVPDPRLDLVRVSGDLTISRGILEGNNLEAEMGRIRATGGSLRLGLAGEDPSFYLDTMVTADLAQVPPLLKRLIDDELMAREIDLVEELRGSATARVVLDKDNVTIRAGVDVTELDFSAIYKRIPYPLAVRGGKVSFQGSGLSLADIKGRFGNTGFSGVSGRVDWGKEAYLEVTAGKVDISVDEIYTWISSLETMRPRLKDLKVVGGAVSMSEISLKGPVLRPQDWRFKTAGMVRDLSLETNLLKGPVKTIRASFDATEKQISVKDAQVSLLDASLTLSTVLDGYMKGLEKADTRFRGFFGPEVLGKASALISTPPDLNLRTPFSVSDGRLLWERDGNIAFMGDLLVKEGPQITVDIRHGRDELHVKNLDIRDKESSVSIGLHLDNREISIRFAGHLSGSTLNPFLLNSKFPAVSIKGDFQARIPRDHLAGFTAKGKMEASDVHLPWDLGRPLNIRRLSLRAEEGRLLFEPVIADWGDSRLVLEGEMHHDMDEIRLDMDLSADGLDAVKLLSLVPRKDQKKAPTTPPGPPRVLPVRGELRVKCDYLKYGSLTWRPLHVNISFDPDGISALIRKADLCGISMPGTLKLSPQGLQVDFRPVSSNQGLNETTECLLNKKLQMDGRFDLKGRVTGQGAAQGLFQSLQGSMDFLAKDGRIYHGKHLAKLLTLLNISEIFRGSLPELDKEGFAYHSIIIKVRLKNGILIVEEAIMDGRSINLAGSGQIDLSNQKIDLMILASLLKTADRIIKKIPLVSYVLDGTLISVPVRVTGDLADPKINYVPASAVGSGLLGMIKRTLKLPIKVIDPVLPNRSLLP